MNAKRYKNKSKMSDAIHEEVTQENESSAGIAGDLVVNSRPADEMPPVREKGSDAGHECRSMASEFENGEVASPVAENETVQSGISSTANKEIKKKKLIDSSHGLRFESKLLLLFCVRGLGAAYKFELSKEKEEEGGKLEDLIFRYEVPDETPVGKHWRYRYLQAKHKENEGEKIIADLILDYKPKGDFSLPKYFHSFYKIRARGDDIHDCIICTNIGFDVNSLEKGGVELVSINDQPEDILEFGALEKTARYKLKINNDDWHRRLKEEWSPIQLLAKELKDCATKNKTTDIRAGMLNSYHVALVDEHVIDCTKKKFHLDFLSDTGSLSGGAKELRQTFCSLCENDEWKNWKFKLSNNFGKSQSAVKNPLPRTITEKDVDDFFDKLIFVVDMPHEKKFEEILETRDMSKYYQPDKCKAQTIRILHEVSKEFSNQERNFWLKSEKAKNILLAHVTKMSLEYQSRLEKDIKFNDGAIQMMVNQLKQRLLPEASGRKQVERIATPSPQHTAVKVISAVQILMRELKQEGNYLVTASSRLQNEEERKRWKNILKLPKYSHHFFVVVCDDEASISSYENFIADDQEDDNKFIIIVSRDGPVVGIIDKIKFTDLSEDYQESILMKTVWFQGKDVTVKDLVGDRPEEIIDFSSMKELSFEEKIKIPSFYTSTFEQSLYVKRKLRLPIVNQWELGEECKINSYGQIEWLVEKEKRKEIWEKIKSRITNQASSEGVTVDDLAHLKENGNEKSVVIISGLAGTGKSTLLCNYYEIIKKAKPDHWVIRINLVDHYEAISKQDTVTTPLDPVEFFVYQLHAVDDNSSFSRLLLRKRLEMGDRIVVMFDGFDEINDQCQDKAMELMKAITKNNSIQIYVTTRPHMLDKLQFQLSQLSYSLANFERNDQIDFLTKYWEKELDLIGDTNGPIQQFAESLVDRVSETLKDKESSFIGIPLQCRIIAECFQSKVRSTLGETGRATQLKADLFDGQRFDLANLYRRLMETKRRVFIEEKAKIPSSSLQNDIVVDAINQLIQDVEGYLTKLAIKTIVTDKKNLEILLSHQSLQLRSVDENTIALNSLKFGLTFKNGDESKVQFLHRTYAEYLFARYLYKGFLLDEKRHNKLLENESIRMLILKKILARPEYHGVQVFFNSMLKELVDGDEEWRNRIYNRDLPERIKKLTENFLDQYLPEDSPPPLPDTEISGGCLWTSIFQSMWNPYHRYDTENALHFSLGTGNTIIFTFFCDCLDATLDGKQVRIVMMKSFKDKCDFSFELFRQVESKYFKRFIDYFDSYESASVILSRFSSCLPPCNSEYSEWNGEEQQKTVHHLLQFMTNQYEAFDKYFNPYRGITTVPMLTFLIFNENYDSHLKIFLGLLLRSTEYRGEEFQFADLLKKIFYSKKHFVGGRIEKVLITLRELNKQKLLTQLYGIVLAIEPESFQNIYQPLPLEGDSLKEEMHLKMLMERDSYRMTRLHRAAFHGNTKAVEEMLGTIRQNLTDPEQKEVANQVINEVMVRDEFGFTPLYMAAVLGKEEIYHKMLTFLKEILPDYRLETKLNGFVYRALSHAIDAENIQMFQLILKAVKKVLGQQELIRILRLQKYYDSNSFFVECITKELFNEMAKVVVMGDDNVKDYTDFYDLVFHNHETLKSLEYIDVENLQGLLSLKGVDDFTKRIQDNMGSTATGFSLLSCYLLEHFKKYQLEQFVETIISKNNFQEIKGNRRRKAKRIRHNSLDLEWAIKGLEFHEEGKGCTVPINTYWRDFIISAARANFSHLVFRIFDCLKRVNDSFRKKLLLHEDDNGFIVICLSLDVVKRMLTYLSKKSQEEVKQQWKDNAPSMDKFFSLTKEQPDIYDIESTARRWTNVLRFYLEYGNEVQLKEFVKTLTFVRHIGVEWRISVWSYIFQHCHKEERTKEILKLVSAKADILGRDSVKTKRFREKVLFHKMNEIPLLFKAVLWGQDIDARLKIFPEEIKEEIQQFMTINAPGLIDQAFQKPQTYFKRFDSQHYYKRLNTLISFLNYSNDIQLQQFVQNITLFNFIIPINAPIQQEKKCSIWAELLTHACHDHNTDIAKMDKFMKRLSEKLGSNAVKELVLHNDGERPVILYPALRGEQKLQGKMLKYLSAEDRKDVQCQVDKFLEETCKTNVSL